MDAHTRTHPDPGALSQGCRARRDEHDLGTGDRGPFTAPLERERAALLDEEVIGLD